MHGIVARVFTAGIARRAGRQRERSGDQRAFRSLSSLPGAVAISSRWRNASGLRGLKLAYVGDGNNICHSLLVAGARVGRACAHRYAGGLRAGCRILSRKRKRVARETRGKIEFFRSPEEAVAGAQAVYTDVWASMGQESEAAAREVFRRLPGERRARVAHAAPDAIFLHCLPAHRGSEVSEDVMDSPRSIVFEQAENRLHVQKAILLTLLINFGHRSRRTHCQRKLCSPIRADWIRPSLFRG